MLDLFEQKGCKVDSVFVQQRVPVDLELRMFVVNGKVERILYTRLSNFSTIELVDRVFGQVPSCELSGSLYRLRTRD